MLCLYSILVVIGSLTLTCIDPDESAYHQIVIKYCLTNYSSRETEYELAFRIFFFFY